MCKLPEPVRLVPFCFPGKTKQRGNQCINVPTGVVQSQRGSNSAFHTKSAQDRLGAMVSRADSDAFTIQILPDLFCAEAVYYKGEYGRLLACGSDDPQPRNALQRIRGIDKQFMLVTGYVGHPDAIKIVDSGAQTDSVRD